MLEEVKPGKTKRQRAKRAARLQRYAVAVVVAIVLVLWSYDIWFTATQP